MKENLLKETREALAANGLTPEDVHFVCCDSSYVDWQTFERMAVMINYNSGYGSQKINDQLKVVGDNWWLERSEYDGLEWWEFKRKPEIGDKPMALFLLG